MEVISKEKALAVLRQLLELPNEMRVQAMAAVSRLKAEEAVLVVHGKWLINPDGYYPYCSVCKAEPKHGEMTKHCPECGARMDKEVEIDQLNKADK